MNHEAALSDLTIRSSALVDIAGMATFVAVIDSSSFTGASRRLGTSKSVVSRRISDMELQLGARLIDRSAVRVNATEVGAVYYAKCVRILQSIEVANDFVASFHGGIRGSLRVLVPRFFCTKVVAPLLSEFAINHPSIKIEVEVDEHEACLQEVGFDVALRIGRLPDSSLVARTLSISRMWLCASPEYLRSRGTPASPEELGKHDGLLHFGGEDRMGWCLLNNGRPHAYRLRERMRSACYYQLLDAAKSGLGLALLPGYLVADSVLAGELNIILPDAALPPAPVSLVYPHSRKISQKVQALVEFLIARIPNPSPWELSIEGHVKGVQQKE